MSYSRGPNPRAIAHWEPGHASQGWVRKAPFPQVVCMCAKPSLILPTTAAATTARPQSQKGWGPLSYRKGDHQEEKERDVASLPLWPTAQWLSWATWDKKSPMLRWHPDTGLEYSLRHAEHPVYECTGKPSWGQGWLGHHWSYQSSVPNW